MFAFLIPKEETLEDVEAKIAAKERIMSMVSKTSVNELKELEGLYYKQIILTKQQQARESND